METPSAISRKRILIIDDDTDLLELLEDVLVNCGIDVQTANHPDNILRQIEQYKPDLVILDYLLNGVNGGEICHQVKTSAKTACILVMLFSAFPKVFLSLGNYGCDLFVAKPFDIWVFLQQINDLLKTDATDLRPNLEPFGEKSAGRNNHKPYNKQNDNVINQ